MPSEVVLAYKEKKKKIHSISSSHLRADKTPGPPREGQLLCVLFLGMRQQTNQLQGCHSATQRESWHRFEVLETGTGGSRSDLPPSMRRQEPEEAEAPPAKPRASRKQRARQPKLAATG